MKKIISILLVGTMAFGLCACGSNDKLTPATPELTIESTLNATEMEYTEKLIDETTQASNQNFYSIEGKSSEELFNMLVGFSNNIPSGTSLDEFPNRFEVEPKGVSLDGSYYYCMFDYTNEDVNYITAVSIADIQQEMDNTITINEYSRIGIGLVLDNYETASDLYNRLFEYLCQNTPHQYGNPSDYREGTQWRSQVNCICEDDYYGGYCYNVYVKLTKDENTGNYNLSVELPIYTQSITPDYEEPPVVDGQ